MLLVNNSIKLESIVSAGAVDQWMVENPADVQRAWIKSVETKEEEKKKAQWEQE